MAISSVLSKNQIKTHYADQYNYPRTKEKSSLRNAGYSIREIRCRAIRITPSYLKYLMVIRYKGTLNSLVLSSLLRTTNIISRTNLVELETIAIYSILKHLRQFVQSDWFLPVFISHDKDTASGRRIDPFKRRVLFSY